MKITMVTASRPPSSCSGPRPRPAAATEAWAQAWATRGRTALVPDLTPQPGLVVLESPGLEALAAVSASGAGRAVLCGSGYGAMVALHVAANYPDRVAALVLSTASTLVDRQRRGIANAAYGLLPVARVQQLHGPQRRVLELLDQVRTVDWSPFAEPRPDARRWSSSASGTRSTGPRAAGSPRCCPSRSSCVVPGARTGWATRDPAALVDASAAFLERLGV